MTTGKIEYSPDYKSDFTDSLREGKSVAEAMLAANDKATERARLEREVIERAKAWQADRFGPFELETQLSAAIAALKEFEAQPK